MSKETHVQGVVKEEVLEGLRDLQLPVEGKRLIVFVSASSVRLRVVEDVSTIQEQATEPGRAVT